MVPRLFRIGPRRRRYNNDPVTQRTRSRLLFPGGIFRPATMAPTIWIDGEFYDKANAKVSVFDHGLLYGDGVFEGIRVYNRRVFRLDKHLDRLYDSAKGAWIEIPMAKAELLRLVGEAVTRSGLEDAYIRLVVTRGIGDLGLDPRKCVKPSIILIVASIRLWPADQYDKGLTALTAATPLN